MTDAGSGGLRASFSALYVRNFRLYFVGQFVSTAGSWTQNVAQALLVLQLTGRGADVGVTFALQYLPILLLGPLSGRFSDRYPLRKVLYVTQCLSILVAVVMGLLVATDTVELWMVYSLAFALGAVTTFDLTARHTLIYSMVGREQLTNAISLNSVMFNLGRIVGPVFAGVAVSTIGLAACFFANGLSFAVALVALAMLRASEMHAPSARKSTDGSVREGLRHAWAHPEIRTHLLMATVIGLLTWEYPISIPLFATFTFDGGASSVSAMFALMGIGAILSGFFVARRTENLSSSAHLAAIVLGFVMTAAAFAPSIEVAVLAMLPMGAAGLAYTSLSQAAIQIASEPDMRGRMISLRSTAWLGSSAVGGPLVGWLADVFGARSGIAVGGLAALICGVLARPDLVSRARRWGDRDVRAATTDDDLRADDAVA